MIKLRPSENKKNIFSFISKKRANYYNSREFYNNHPDLAPRNVHLYLGRIITKEEMDKRSNELFREPFTTRAKDWFKNKIGKLFSRDKK